MKLSFAIEDSSSNDVVAREPVLTRSEYPDFIGTVNVGSADNLRAMVGFQLF